MLEFFFMLSHLQFEQLKSQFNELVHLKETAVKEQNFMEADKYNHQINDLKLLILNTEEEMKTYGQAVKRTDIPTLKKYLDIASSLLSSPQITFLSPTLATLKDDIEMLLIHANDSVRTKALKCYALFCLIDKKCAQIGIHICSVPVSSFFFYVGYSTAWL